MRGPKQGEWVAERTGAQVAPGETAALAAKAGEAATFRLCGLTLRLRCDDAAWLARFARAFRHMAAEPRGGVRDLVYLTRASGPEGFPALLDPAAGRAKVFAHESVSPTQLFACLLIDGFLPVEDSLVLHASVLKRGTGVTAFLGRTHAGKTTLALRLALEEGVSFLSDEYCPVRVADGLVEPLPRVLGVRRWTRSMLEARGALETGEVVKAEVEIDPAELRGFTLGSGGRLRNVVLVAGEAGEAVPEGVRDLDVEFVNEALLADLRGVQGVRGVEARDESVGSGRHVRVHVEEGAKVTEALMAVCEAHGMTLHGLLPPGARRPDFSAPPLLAPLDPFRGTMEVVRHIVNRTVLQGDGSLARLLDLAAGALAGVRFFQLRPGPLDETARLVAAEVL